MTATRPPALATWLLKHAASGNDALGFLSFDTQGELKLMLASIRLENRVDLLHGLIGRVDSVDGESLGAAR